jgi:cobalt-zinc-cadmium resistance protein CzcA
VKATLQNQYQQGVQNYLKCKMNLAYYKASARSNADLIQRQSELGYQQGNITYAQHLFNLQQALTINENYLHAINQYNQSTYYLDYLTGKK